MPEASNLSVSLMSDQGSRKTKIARMLTLESMIEWIRSQGLDEFTTKGLIELASKYPYNALPSFKKNFNLMLQRVRAKRQKEGEVEREKTIEKEPKEPKQNFKSFEEGLNSNWDGKKEAEPGQGEVVDISGLEEFEGFGSLDNMRTADPADNSNH